MKRGICMLIDVGISGDRNVIHKGAINIPNFKRFATEIHRM
jgi:hypothetical protein